MFGSWPITALLGAMAPVAALAAPAGGQHPFEACVINAALTLEPGGRPVDAVLAQAQQACGSTRGKLADASVSEVLAKARLAVMQQRSNALNTRTRG
jgi:hypothetical protein